MNNYAHYEWTINSTFGFIYLQINTSLVDAYEYMQKYAVGLEQVVLDQKDYQPKYHQKFTEAEWKLRAVSFGIKSVIFLSNYAEPRIFDLPFFLGARYKKKELLCTTFTITSAQLA